MPTWPTIAPPSPGVALSFLDMMGEPDSPSRDVLTVRHPGVDGAVYQKLGKRPDDWTLTTVADCDNDGGAKDVAATMAAYKALVGTIVTVNTQRQTALAVCVVLDVKKVGVQRIAAASTGISTDRTRLLTAQWRLQDANLA